MSSSTRDSVLSTTTSRFSSLLSSSSSSSSPSSSNALSTHPVNDPSSSSSTTKRSTAIYDRPLTKSRGTLVSYTSWALLLGEMVHYTQQHVHGISEFEHRLNSLGYHVGTRLVELLPLRDSVYPATSSALGRAPPPPTRPVRLLPLLSYVHSPLYKYLFHKPADSLERSTEHDDEYMIGDDDMLATRSVHVPKEMQELSCAALVAGIVEAVLDGHGFPSRVTAHSVPTAQHPRRTVILIKLDPSVVEREKALSGGGQGTVP
ncbi:hypothetical protein JCM10212_006577 [Sporobolomyces blumeae]